MTIRRRQLQKIIVRNYFFLFKNPKLKVDGSLSSIGFGFIEFPAIIFSLESSLRQSDVDFSIENEMRFQILIMARLLFRLRLCFSITKWTEDSDAGRSDSGAGCLSGLEMAKREDSPCTRSTFRCPITLILRKCLDL